MSQPERTSIIEHYLRLKWFERSGRFYELIGIRGFYAWITGVGGGKPLPNTKNPAEIPVNHLETTKADSRYFEIANLLRAGFYLPPMVALFIVRQWFGFGILLFLVVFHFLCVATERYKRALLNIHQPGPAEPLVGDPNATITQHWFYSPKKFETNKFYRRIGLDYIRGRVRYYTRKTRFSRGEEKPVEYIEDQSPAAYARFEQGTRIGEMLHLVAMFLNLPPAFTAALAREWIWMVYLLLVAGADLYLALLQRYHRRRVTIAYNRLRSKLE